MVVGRVGGSELRPIKSHSHLLPTPRRTQQKGPHPHHDAGPPVVVLISHTAEVSSSSAAATASALLSSGLGKGGAPSRRKGLRKVIEGLRRFGPLWLVEGDASTEEGLVYVLPFGACVCMYAYVCRVSHLACMAATQTTRPPSDNTKGVNQPLHQSAA